MKQILAVSLFFLLQNSHLTAQQVVTHPSEIITDIHHDVSLPLREMQLIEPGTLKPERAERVIPNNFYLYDWIEVNKSAGRINEVDPVVQDWMGTSGPVEMIVNFEGIGGDGSIVPPDVNGDVGLNHYIQAVNLSFAIYAKTGALVYGPAFLRTLWEGFPPPTVCDGDPVVLYDHLANRWLIINFSLPNYPNGPYYMLFAVSQSDDPLGPWNRYSFKFNKLPDYPKLGVWPDGYYLSANSFSSGALKFNGPLAAVFERDSMLIGGSARMVCFQQDTSFKSMLPADLDGPPPPVGTAGLFLSVRDDAMGNDFDQLNLFQLHTDWADTSNCSFTGPLIMETAPFDMNMCGNTSGGCIPQKNTSRRLDALAQYLMHRLQYRNFGSYQAMVVNHTVDIESNNHAGVRWYEIRKSAYNWNIYQQGTYAPDALHRWIASAAMDGNGNIALGYSVSGDTVFPSIGITGRRAGDPLNQMNCIEELIMAGNGAQTGESRWGDYSALSIDPSDDETFWYTNQYYAATSAMKWNTRIASFAVNDLEVSVKENSQNKANKYYLKQNYPNPFSKSTMISWIMPGHGRVKVQVYSVTGTLIKTLVDRSLEPGEHTAEFDASALNSGVYICRLSTKEIVEAQMLILIK